jgi:DNA-directed RNA polymerase specialized sigma24 family protein
MANGIPFHSTRWTLVRRAQGRGHEARAALSELCAIYYEPVLQFTRHWCGSEDRAKDLAHGFFEDLLGRESLGAADPAKGRFRSYLLAAVKHYLSRQREKEVAAKRGGDMERIPLDEAPESGMPPDWDREFDRAWALALIRRALDSLAAEMERAGKGEIFAQLRPWLDGGSPGEASTTAAGLGLSASAFKVAIHRLRERFRRQVRDEIAATTTDPAETEAEFRHLVEVWISADQG